MVPPALNAAGGQRACAKVTADGVGREDAGALRNGLGYNIDPRQAKQRNRGDVDRKEKFLHGEIEFHIDWAALGSRV